MRLAQLLGTLDVLFADVEQPDAWVREPVQVARQHRAHRGELHEVVRRIQSVVRKTIVLVTHDMREAFALADRIGVLHDGALVACATASELQQSDQPEVRTLLQAGDR